MANGTDHNPLNADHLKALNQVLQMIPETDRTIAKVAASGIDVEQARIENAQQRELAAALKRNFFPNEP